MKQDGPGVENFDAGGRLRKFGTSSLHFCMCLGTIIKCFLSTCAYTGWDQCSARSSSKPFTRVSSFRPRTFLSADDIHVPILLGEERETQERSSDLPEFAELVKNSIRMLSCKNIPVFSFTLMTLLTLAVDFPHPAILQHQLGVLSLTQFWHWPRLVQNPSPHTHNSDANLRSRLSLWSWVAWPAVTWSRDFGSQPEIEVRSWGRGHRIPSH